MISDVAQVVRKPHIIINRGIQSQSRLKIQRSLNLGNLYCQGSSRIGRGSLQTCILTHHHIDRHGMSKLYLKCACSGDHISDHGLVSPGSTAINYLCKNMGILKKA